MANPISEVNDGSLALTNEEIEVDLAVGDGMNGEENIRAPGSSPIPCGEMGKLVAPRHVTGDAVICFDGLKVNQLYFAMT